MLASAKATAENRPLFLGLYIQTCIGSMSVVKTVNSTANECECHPCAGCHAMLSAFNNSSDSSLLMWGLNQISTLSPHLRVFSHTQRFLQLYAKLALWQRGVGQCSAAWKKLFVLQTVLWFCLTSFQVSASKKHIVSQICNFSEQVASYIHGICCRYFGFSQVPYWPSIEVDQQLKGNTESWDFAAEVDGCSRGSTNAKRCWKSLTSAVDLLWSDWCSSLRNIPKTWV